MSSRWKSRTLKWEAFQDFVRRGLLSGRAGSPHQRLPTVAFHKLATSIEHPLLQFFFGKFTAIFCIKKGTIFSKNQTGVCFFFFLILKGPDFVIIIWWGLLTEEQLEASEPRNPENQKPENSNLAKAQPPTHSLAFQLHLSNLFDRQNNKHIWARKTHK